MDKIIYEIKKKNVFEYYKSMYDNYRNKSICLNINRHKSENVFRFLREGYILIGTISKVLIKSSKNDPKIFDFVKTEDCKIIINSIGEYTMMKMLIHMLKKDIKLWEKTHSKRIGNRYNDIHLSSDIIKTKAAVDVLKEEIKFAQNNLKFEKGWFTRLN